MIWPSPAVIPSTALCEEAMTLSRARFGTFQLTGRPRARAQSPSSGRARSDPCAAAPGAAPAGDSAQRGALPADRAPGDDQPDAAEHEEQRDDVMQAAAVAMSPMYIPGRLADPPVPP